MGADGERERRQRRDRQHRRKRATAFGHLLNARLGTGRTRLDMPSPVMPAYGHVPDQRAEVLRTTWRLLAPLGLLDLSARDALVAAARLLESTEAEPTACSLRDREAAA